MSISQWMSLLRWLCWADASTVNINLNEEVNANMQIGPANWRFLTVGHCDGYKWIQVPSCPAESSPLQLAASIGCIVVAWSISCPVWMVNLCTANVATKASGCLLLKKLNLVSFYVTLHLMMCNKLNTLRHHTLDIGPWCLIQISRFVYPGEKHASPANSARFKSRLVLQCSRSP